MFKDIISRADGMWVCDPQKMGASQFFSAVVTDRAGPDDIARVLAAADLKEGRWRYYRQGGSNLV